METYGAKEYITIREMFITAVRMIPRKRDNSKRQLRRQNGRMESEVLRVLPPWDLLSLSISRREEKTPEPKFQ